MGLVKRYTTGVYCKPFYSRMQAFLSMKHRMAINRVALVLEISPGGFLKRPVAPDSICALHSGTDAGRAFVTGAS